MYFAELCYGKLRAPQTKTEQEDTFEREREREREFVYIYSRIFRTEILCCCYKREIGNGINFVCGLATCTKLYIVVSN
jgi:hypothetical protein